MKNFNPNYANSIIELNCQPRAYVRIETTGGYDIYLTTHTGIITPIAPDILVDGVVSGLNTGSETITPEKGFSVLGGGSISLNEALFTDELRDLLANNKTIFNNKVELFSGTADIDINDYEKVYTLYVKNISSNDVSYTIQLSTAQIFSNKQILKKKTTELFTGFNFDDELTEIEVLSTDEFELVAHDSEWENSPSEEVGYLTFIGQDADGNPVTEIMKYWSKDATKFYGDPSNSNLIERSVFNTGRVTATGTSESDTATLVEERIYIDLAAGKMIIALLTGDLYGQAGKTLPDHWHAGIDPAFINITSIENIGFDLWNPSDSTGFHFYIDNLPEENSKSFIAREILRVASLAFLTDVNGEIACKRYSQVIKGASTQTVLNDNDISNKPNFSRNSGDIRNEFSVFWDYRPEQDRFIRAEVIIDQDSIDRNGIASRVDPIKLKAVRNNQIEVTELLKTVTDGIRTRLTNPSLKPKINASFRRCVALEVLDVIGLNLEGFSDYSDAGDINRPFEIQSIQHDWINRTVNLSLFGSTDPASPIDISANTDTAVIDHTGWLSFESNLTGTFTDSGSILTLTSDCVLGSISDIGLRKLYYYDGEINLNGFELEIFGTVIIDSNLFDATNSSINGIGNGTAGGLGQSTDVVNLSEIKGEAGYFGSYDTSEEGLHVTYHSFSLIYLYRSQRPVGSINNDGVSTIDNFILDISDNNVLSGLPTSLTGNAGSGGLRATDIGFSTGNPITYPLTSDGGDGANGGAGLFIFANSFVSNLNTDIDLSADNLTDLPLVELIGPKVQKTNMAGGRGGVGNGGCLGVFIKNRSNPLLSNSDGIFKSRSGTLIEWSDITYPTRPKPHETFRRGTRSDETNYLMTPFFNENSINNVSGVDFAGAAFLSKYINGAIQNIPQVGRDPIGLVPAPTNLTLTESIDTPSTPLGNLSTITANVTAPSNTNYSHTIFSFRLVGQTAFYPTTYKVAEETSFEVQSNGGTYEVKAQSVSKQGVLGGAITNTKTVKNVLTEPAIEPSVDIPRLTGLQLKNRIANNVLDKFKSGNAEFVWNAISNNSSVGFGNEGLLGADSGSFDPYFKDYKVDIYDINDNLLSTEFTKTESFTYSYDKNKKDGLNREFIIQVRGRGQLNQIGEGSKFTVSNPESSAVTGISAKPSYNSIQVEYTAPTDIDFIGVNMRFRETPAGLWSAIFFFATTACNVADLQTGTEYEIELTSVDEFGTGGTTSVISTTTAVEAEQIDGLSNWATELDPVDLAFINANMDNDAVPSDKISSLVAGKITAGQIDVAVDIGTGVQLDGANGTVKTINSGFKGVMGTADGAWNQLPNPTIYTAIDTNTNTQVFGVDVLGNCIIGDGDSSVLFDQTTNTIQFGDTVTIGSNVNQTVTVGGGGDYATINDALEQLSKIVPAYKEGGFTATINILTGTVIAENIEIVGVDLSFIKISSVDAVVTVNININESFISVKSGGRSPIIDTIFRSTTNTGTRMGINVDGGGSSAQFSTTGSGMENFGFNLLAQNYGHIYAVQTSLIDGDSAITAINGGEVVAINSTLDNSFNIVTADNAQVRIDNSSAINSSTAIFATGAEVNANNVDFSGWVDAFGLGDIISATNGSNVTLIGSDLTSPTNTNSRIAILNTYSDVFATNVNFEIGSGNQNIVQSSGGRSTFNGVSYINLQMFSGTYVIANGTSNSLFDQAPITPTADGILFL